MALTAAFFGMVGQSRAQRRLVELVRRAAPAARTALITGETGTGKELVAHALHALGPRPDRPFIVVNCAMLATPVSEPEWASRFGRVCVPPVARTIFEQANGATLFLDEIGDLPIPMQAQLLHALEYGEVCWGGGIDACPSDLVAIASTNRDLAFEAAAGRFRRDLFYRLGVVHLPVPSLRERREDIPPLTSTFLTEFSRSIRKVRGVAASAERLLQRVDWPGNVRELRNVLQRACIRTEDDTLSERVVAAALLRPEIQAIAYRHAVRPAGAAAC